MFPFSFPKIFLINYFYLWSIGPMVIYLISKKKPSKYSSWWRRLEEVLKTSFVFVFRRRLEDVLVKTNIFVLAIRLQDAFKTFSRSLQDVFKTYHEVKLFLLTRVWEAFNTFLRGSFPKTIIYRGLSPGNTTSDKFMASIQNLQER